MSELHVDFGVVGSTPQARLVAGLLAAEHGRTVALWAESHAAYRLPQGLDLSTGAITRPQTWALLKTLVPETVKLVGRMGGRSVWSRTDPILFADTPVAAEAISHIRHMASAFGIAAERVPPDLIGSERTAIYMRDSIILNRGRLEPAFDRWLAGCGVHRLEGTVTCRTDGSGTGRTGDGECEIRQVVLADDPALLRHLPPESWPAPLLREPSNTLLLEPTAPMAGLVMHQLDTGIMLHRQPQDGLVALGPGGTDAFAARVAALLGPERPVRLAGQARHERVVTADGAPALGRVGGNGVDVLAGFGETAAFFAPAIARWLCGQASPAEATWFADRLVTRDPATSSATDFRAAA